MQIMQLIKRWWASRLNVKNFDPFWAGFFTGIVFFAMVATGALLIYLDHFSTAQSCMGVFLLAGAAIGFAVQMAQKHEYRPGNPIRDA